MTETRAPYFVNGRATRLLHPAATEATLAENELMSARIHDLEQAVMKLSGRLAHLTATAREVCRCWQRAGDGDLDSSDKAAVAVIEHQEALRDLANEIDYPSWWQL